jgi:DNA sulfur modification protein DndB
MNRPENIEKDAILDPLLEGSDALKKTYRRRKDEDEYLKIKTSDSEKYFEQGWETHKEIKDALWVKRRKSAEQLLENRIWMLFYRMGYPSISGNDFHINYRKADGSVESEAVNVLAADLETVVVVECKARASLGRRNLQKDIQQTEVLQKPFGRSIRRHFGENFNPKIIWMYATNNIIWNEKDLEAAEAANIRVVTENEIQYYEAFASHIGTAGRYQFLAQFLEGQVVPGLGNVRIPAVRGHFGKNKYYSFVVSARHLLKIAYVNHQALNHPDGRPAYQRMINKNRIAVIGNFIQGGGYFPTNVLLNFTEECRFDFLPNKENTDKDIKFGWLYLPNKYKSAWVIDGQHRLYGFSNIPDTFLDNNLFVLAFEKMDTKTEADLFITINHEQKSVSKSLLVTLQADLKLGSGDPKEAIGALASSIVRSVSNDATSPFYRRFGTPGVVATESQNLTIAEAVKGLVRSNLLGRALPKKSKVPGFLSGQTDADTMKKARIILNGYFQAIMEASVDRWQKGRAAHICVNPGIRAHFQLIQEALIYLQSNEKRDPQTDSTDNLVAALKKFIKPFLDFVTHAPDNDIEKKFARKFGEGGVLAYFYNLCDILHTKHKEFGSKEFKKFKSQQADARVDKTDKDISDLQSAISEVVIESLKKIHGIKELPSGEKAYWDLGIENADIKQNAYKKQQSAPAAKRALKEAYLDLIDFEKIIKQPNNWPQFEPIFNIPTQSEPKGKKYYLHWLERLNEIRRTSAHKSPYRSFSEEDFEFIAWLNDELYDRFKEAGFEFS